MTQRQRLAEKLLELAAAIDAITARIVAAFAADIALSVAGFPVPAHGAWDDMGLEECQSWGIECEAASNAFAWDE